MFKRQKQDETALPAATKLLTNKGLGLWTGLLTILFTLSFIGIWSWKYPIEQSIALNGKVEASTETKAIQHLEGGIIDAILVTEGQEVKAGDVLIKLKETQSAAEFQSLRSQYDEAQIQRAMLQAKKAGIGQITPPKTVDSQNQVIQGMIAQQNALLKSSLDNRNAQLLLYQQRIDELSAIIQGANEQLIALEKQISLTKSKVENLTKLRQQGHVTRTQLEASQSELLNFEQESAAVRTRITEANEKKHTTEAERTVFLETDREKTEKALSEVEGGIARGKAQLDKLSDILERTDIIAPEDGIIVDIAPLGDGNVITSGQTLMRVLPKDDPLVIQVYVPPASIDKVYPGQLARVMFSSFDTKQSPTVEGELRYISDDLVPIDEQNSLYVGEIIFDRADLDKDFNYRLRPGMQASVFLDAGEITLLGYIIKPLAESLNYVFIR